MPEAEAAAQSRLSRQSAVRSAILEAGRRFALREGSSNMSLSSVAAEAGLNPSTVFGLFRNKDDLLLAIVAEDLTMVAAAMRDRLLGRVQEKTTNEEADLAGTVASSRAQEDSPTLENAAAVTESLHSDATWSLDQRFQAFEHSIAVLDGRLEKAAAEASRSATLSEESMKTVLDRIETFERQHKDMLATLMQRVEETERRQRGITSELRTAMNDAATRIEILESARRAEQERSAGKHAPAPSAAPGPSRLALAEPEASNSPNTEPDDGAYRQAAERAASAAATLAAMEQTNAAPKQAIGDNLLVRRIPVRRQHWIAAASIVVAVFIAGAFAAFSFGHARGREMQLALLSPPLHALAARHPAAAAHAAQTLTRTTALGPGDANAELALGLKLLHGQGTTADHQRAAEWIRRAADKGQPLAQYWLGNLLEHGDGLHADAAAAIRWYEAAAVHGNRKAMHALGVAYAEGIGTRKDDSEAARWFTQAAQLGLVNSQFNLGVLYERGLGVRQSLVDAYRWYAIAAGQGDQESRNRVEALKTQLNPAELASAERAAASFHPAAANRLANEPPPASAALARR